MNFATELCWWLKGKVLTSPQQVEEERAALGFARSRLDLENGYIFDWTNDQQHQTSSSSSLLTSALSSLVGGGTASSSSADSNKPCQVLVRLHVAKPSASGAFAAASAKVVNAVMTGGGGEEGDNVTCLTWTALLLEQNRPNPVHRVALHKVQTVRVAAETNTVTLADHTGQVLFKGASPDAAKWADQVNEARRVLASQLEEEANNSGHYHEQKLQRIETRRLEREELRKQFAQ